MQDPPAAELEQVRAVLAAPIEAPLPLLVWHGPAGAGKRALRRLIRERAQSDFPDVPLALWDFGLDRLQRDRTLLAIARAFADWSRGRRGPTFEFHRFELALALLHYRLGETVSAIAPGEGHLRLLSQAVASLVPLPLVGDVVHAGLRRVAEGLTDLVPGVRKFLERAVGGQYVTRLRAMETAEVADELLPALVLDLEDALPPRERHAARAVLALDGYERLLAPALAASYDDWVREALAPTLRSLGILLLVFSRVPLGWPEEALADLRVRQAALPDPAP